MLNESERYRVTTHGLNKKRVYLRVRACLHGGRVTLAEGLP